MYKLPSLCSNVISEIPIKFSLEDRNRLLYKNHAFFAEISDAVAPRAWDCA